MSIDWSRLRELRDRQQLAARQRLVQDREQARQGEQRWQQAQTGLALAVQARQQLWQGCAGEGGSQPIAVAQLHQAGAWSRVLDRAIDDAAVAQREARLQADRQQLALQRSQRHLRDLALASERARLMQQRVRSDLCRQGEARLEDQCDEAAMQAWLLRAVRRARER